VMLAVLVASVRAVRRSERDLETAQRLRPARERRRPAASVPEGSQP